MQQAFPELLAEQPQPGSYSAGLIPLWEPGPATVDRIAHGRVRW